MSSSKLYAIQYVEPGNQEAAVKTYTPTAAVKQLIAANGNITIEARNKILSNFDDGVRSYVEGEKGAYAASSQNNLETGIQKEIQNAKSAREAYLSGLTSY